MEYFKLITCIFLPPLLSLTVILASICLPPRSRKKISARIRDAVSLHAERGLIHQRLLWACILTPIFYFLTIGLFIWADYSPAISAEGFKKFIQISALPLGILSLAIPLSVLVSRFHATEQTAIQIKAAKAKNNMDAFYSHRKAMFDYFDKISEQDFDGQIKGVFKIEPTLHKHAFWGASPESGMPTPHDAFFEMVEAELSSARTFIHHVLFEDDLNKRLAFYKCACDALWRTSYNLSLDALTRKLVDNGHALKEPQRKEPEETYTLTIGNTTAELVGTYRYCRQYYRHLCDFSGYKSPFLKEIEHDTSIRSVADRGRRYTEINLKAVDELLEFAAQHLEVESI